MRRVAVVRAVVRAVATYMEARRAVVVTARRHTRAMIMTADTGSRALSRVLSPAADRRPATPIRDRANGRARRSERPLKCCQHSSEATLRATSSQPLHYHDRIHAAQDRLCWYSTGQHCYLQCRVQGCASQLFLGCGLAALDTPLNLKSVPMQTLVVETQAGKRTSHPATPDMQELLVQINAERCTKRISQRSLSSAIEPGSEWCPLRTAVPITRKCAMELRLRFRSGREGEHSGRMYARMSGAISTF